MKQRIIDHILSSSVYDVAKQTDVNYLDFLSSSLGNHIYLKREDQQPVYSFKLRGAYHKISLLSDSQLSAGVVVQISLDEKK